MKDKVVRHKKGITGLICMLLALVLTTSMVPMLAFAGTAESAEQATQESTEGAAPTQESSTPDTSGGGESTGNPETNSPPATDALNTEGNEIVPQNETTTQGEGEDVATFSGEQFSNIDNVVTPSSFQTFDHLQNNTSPPQLTMTLQVQPTAAYSEGARIELPLDYNPVAQNLESFTYGTDGTNGVGNAAGKTTPDFFTLNTAALDAALASSTSIVKSYKIENSVLKLELKSAAEYPGSMAGLKSLQLVFDFNGDYKMKIPAGTIMWKPQSKVYVGSELAQTAVAREVKTSTTQALGAGLERMTPSNTGYVGGTLIVRMNHTNNNYFESDLDPNYKNQTWVEFPAGTVINNANFRSVFKTMETIDGYDRYYRDIDNTKNSWGVWQYSGNKGSVWNQLDASLVIPETIQNGTDFDIRLGVNYQKINGTPQQASSKATYTKIERPAWQLTASGFHSSGGSLTQVCGTEDNAVAQVGYSAPLASYTHNGTIKNTGAEPITGVYYELYQASTTSAKVNYHVINLSATRDVGNPDDLPAFASYRYEYDIVDTQSGTTTTVAGGTFVPQDSGSVQSHALKLPSLTATQYIDIVRVIPLGDDGKTEGEWPARNGLGVSYRVKAWPGQTWPDGTKVPLSSSNAAMGWRLTYNDNPSKPSSYPENGEGVAPKTFKGNTVGIHYSSQPYALANIVSSTSANGVNPGTTVDYTIYGYNNDYNTVSTWKNPQVIIRVPEIMTLKDAGATKTLTNETDGKTYAATATHLGTAGGYNYYSFKAEGYTAPERAGTLAVFSIPVQFELAPTATPGSYAAPRVLTTTTTPSTYSGSTGQTKNGDLGEAMSLYGLGEGDNYVICTSPASSALKVISLPRLDVNSAVSSEATNGLGVTTTLVPAKHGETTKMLLTIANGGNVAFTNLRLYDILPFDKDNLGSSGGISFGGLNILGATEPSIRYTTSGGYPTYGAHGAEASGATGAYDLQAATFQNSWTEGSPSEETKAFFLDFGGQVLEPGQSINIELDFTIPEEGDQTAYNQFRYSAKEVVGNAAALNQNAPAQGFSTKTIGIIYHEGLPALYAEGGPLAGASDLADMPAATTGSYTAEGQKLSVDSKQPALTGYSFKGWATSAGATAAEYQGADEIAFTNAGTKNLYPVWNLSSSAVVYGYVPNAAGDAVPANAPSTAAMGNARADFYSTQTVAKVPTLAGYTFSGWSTGDVALEDGSSFSMPAREVSFTGSWEPKSYELSYDANGGTGTLAPQGVTFDKDYTVAQNSFKRTGYTFAGWNTQADGKGLSFDAGSSYAYTTAANTTLYARWIPNSGVAYKVEHYLVDANGSATLDFTEDLKGTTDAKVNAAPRAYVANTYLASYAGTKATGNVAGDGSLVLCLYYPINRYTVSFVDFDGTVLASNGNVPHGGDALAPANPLRMGYTFTGWDKSFTNITSSLVVTAQYSVNPVVVVPPGPGTTDPTPPTGPETSGETPAVTPPAGNTNSVAPAAPRTSAPAEAAAAQSIADAAEEAGIPTIGVPLAAPAGFEAWALANLVLALLGVVTTFVFGVVRYLRKKTVADASQDAEQAREQSAASAAQNAKEERTAHGRRSIGWLIAAAALALVGAVLFILTQNVSLSLVWVDSWTIVNLALFVGAVITGALAIGRKKHTAEEAEENTATQMV